MVVDKEVDKDKGKDKDKEVDKNVAKQLDFTILISVLIFLIRIVTAESGLRGVGRAFVMSWLDDWTFLYKAQLWVFTKLYFVGHSTGFVGLVFFIRSVE